jgi:hypothetical protein
MLPVRPSRPDLGRRPVGWLRRTGWRPDRAPSDLGRVYQHPPSPAFATGGTGKGGKPLTPAAKKGPLPWPSWGWPDRSSRSHPPMMDRRAPASVFAFRRRRPHYRAVTDIYLNNKVLTAIGRYRQCGQAVDLTHRLARLPSVAALPGVLRIRPDRPFARLDEAGREEGAPPRGYLYIRVSLSRYSDSETRGRQAGVESTS